MTIYHNVNTPFFLALFTTCIVFSIIKKSGKNRIKVFTLLYIVFS